MNFLQQALAYIFSAENWSGKAGLGARILEHLQYTGVAVAVSALIAIPIGLVIGHTGRGSFLVVTAVNALRALPTLGVLLLGVLLWGLGLLPPTVALTLLGVPPLLAGTYAGIANVDPKVTDAARSMGMSGRQVLTKVEVPNAMPLILGGLRTATLQVVATATVAAYASLGGLGRYLIDGIKVRQFYLALVGALHGDGAGAAARRSAGDGGVGVDAREPGRLRRRLPQPLLDDEVRLDAGAPGRTPDSQPRWPVAYGRGVVTAAERCQRATLAGDADVALPGRLAHRVGPGPTERQPDQGARPDRRGGHRDESGVQRLLRPGDRRHRRHQTAVARPSPWPSGTGNCRSPATRRACGW